MIIYLLIATFIFGMFCGSVVESKDKPEVAQWIVLFVLALFWPLMGYVYWKDRKEEKL